MSTKMDNYQLAPHYKNALVVAQFTNSQILNMADADELLTQAATNKSGLHYEQQFAIDRVTNTQTGELALAVNGGFFTDSNVAAANTVEGLENLVEAANTDLPEDFFSGTFLNR